jgi:uncharacterized tellurite resistance protein B-like protein
MTEKLSSGGRARSAILRAFLMPCMGSTPFIRKFRPALRPSLHLSSFCWLIISDGLIHPAETRLLTKLVAPRIKLRRDDVEFVCNQIQERGMDERHLKWLVSFIQSGIAPDAKRELLESLDRLAMADHLLHPAEAAVIRKARELLGDKPLSG